MLAVPLVPVFNHADAAHARQILGACYTGGARAFEFTNRGDNALTVFCELSDFAQQHYPDLQLGIGTILHGCRSRGVPGRWGGLRGTACNVGRRGRRLPAP